jgi:hypothetical protein
MYIEKFRYYMPYIDVAKLVTVTKTNMINKIPVVVRIWYQVCCQDCVEVSAVLEVSHWPALRSQVLLNSSADLCRGLRSSKI